MRAFIPPCRNVYKRATNTVTYSLSLCADYSKMFELKDALGRKLFESIAITLVCGAPAYGLSFSNTCSFPAPAPADECMKTETPEKCTHKLAEMPRWLSSAKMEVVKKLLEDDVCAPSPAPPRAAPSPSPCGLCAQPAMLYAEIQTPPRPCNSLTPARAGCASRSALPPTAPTRRFRVVMSTTPSRGNVARLKLSIASWITGPTHGILSWQSTPRAAGRRRLPSRRWRSCRAAKFRRAANCPAPRPSTSPRAPW